MTNKTSCGNNSSTSNSRYNDDHAEGTSIALDEIPSYRIASYSIALHRSITSWPSDEQRNPPETQKSYPDPTRQYLQNSPSVDSFHISTSRGQKETRQDP